MGRIKQYIQILRVVETRPWFKRVVYLWGFLASYDLLLSQVIPEEYAKKAPKAWEATVLTGGLLPWWGWVLILALILTIASLEYAARIKRSHNPFLMTKHDIAAASGDDIEKHIESREQLQAEAAFQGGFAPNSPNAKEAVLLLLTHLRSEGVEIRNKLPMFLSTTELDSWANRVSRWMEDVVDALKSINAADSKWFATLDAVPASRVPIPSIQVGGQEDHAMFVSIFRQHDYRLARLDALLQKYGVGA